MGVAYVMCRGCTESLQLVDYGAGVATVKLPQKKKYSLPVCVVTWGSNNHSYRRKVVDWIQLTLQR